ncbi:hypothetical protein QL285_087968 [Trifolium repens]|nr:hypothetical protein QL285_087968 [Trifolium repens]
MHVVTQSPSPVEPKAKSGQEEKPETKEPLHVTLSSLLDAMNPSLPFVDDDAAGRRHHMQPVVKVAKPEHLRSKLFNAVARFVVNYEREDIIVVHGVWLARWCLVVITNWLNEPDNFSYIDLITQINDVDHRESWLIPCRESGNKSKSPLGETEVKFQLTRDTYT